MVVSVTRWVLAHRRLVIVGWVLVTIIGIALSGAATKAMDQKFSVPGKEGWDTNVAIAKAYGGTGGNASPLVPIVTLPAGRTAAQERPALTRLEAKVRRALPGSRVAGYGSTGDR